MLPAHLIAEIKRLELKTKHLATDALSGDYKSAFHGRGMEFQEVREYVPGDDVRAIDWNVTAKTSVPHIKVYREEREMTVMLAVDVSSSLRCGGERKRLNAATELAAVIAWIATRSNDRVGLLLFTDRIEHFVAPRKGRGHVWRIIKDLYTHEPSGSKTDISLALDHVQKLVRRRSTFFVISDFWSESFSDSLKRCSRQHDLTCVRVKDPLSETLADAGVVRLRDSETGELLLLDTSDHGVRAAYLSAQESRNQLLAAEFKSSGADYFEISTQGSIVAPLAAYLHGHGLRSAPLHSGRFK